MTPVSPRDTVGLIRELESWNTTLTNKSRFIENIATGKETVTIAMVDRSREAMMQLRQANHVINLISQNLQEVSVDHKNLIDTLLDGAKKETLSANKNFEDIISWIPSTQTF